MKLLSFATPLHHPLSSIENEIVLSNTPDLLLKVLELDPKRRLSLLGINANRQGGQAALPENLLALPNFPRGKLSLKSLNHPSTPLSCQ